VSVSAAFTGLTNETQFWFQASATNSEGTTTSSPILSFRTLGEPGAPEGLKAVFYDQRAYLSWSVPSATGGSPISVYEVQFSLDGTAWTTWNAAVSGTTYVNTSNLSAVPYYFRVRAQNNTGVWGPYATAGPITGCPNNQLQYNGACIRLNYQASGNVNVGSPVSRNLIGNGDRPYDTILILTEPTGDGVGSTSSSGRALTYNAPNAVGSTLIYYTFTGNGGGDGVWWLTVQ
jgi:hypothetical protein